MKITLLSIAVAGAIIASAPAETRSSADYALTTETLDTGGRRVSGTNYSADSSIGAIAGLSTAPTPPETLRSGYVGQLYDQVSLSIAASPTNVNEGTTRQLTGSQILDDGTCIALAGSDIDWGVVSGPITSITPEGLATAGYVYQDTAATVSGHATAFSNSLALAVINVTRDDFGLYAGDGIDDDWQVLYFGEGNANAAPGRDPDRDGRDNLFESLALTVPTDPSSFFDLYARRTPGQPGSVDLIFHPIRTGRTYTVLYSLELSPSGWGTLTGASQSDDGEERTVTDAGTGGAKKFYKVQIAR